MTGSNNGVSPELMRTMAAYYASLGLLVFPLHGVYGALCTCGQPTCKSPAKHPRTQNGLKDASAEADVVLRMWTRWPYASIGIRTGVESRVLVIDYDGSHEALQEAPEFFLRWFREAMPPTWCAATGGGGRHVFFRYDGEGGIQSRSRIWAHPTRRADGRPIAAIDVRADGGYVVGAPSPHISGTSYRWLEGCAPADGELAALPDELEQFLRLNQHGNVVGAPESGPAAAQRAYTPGSLRVGGVPATRELRLHDDDVARIRAALTYVDATDRDPWLFVGMALKSTGAGQQAFDLWTEWSQTVPTKFDPEDQVKTWRGLKELLPSGEEITIRKLFWMAKQRGAPDFTDMEVQMVELPPELPPLPNSPDVILPPAAPAAAPEDLPENDPGEGAEPVPTGEIEPLFADFWPRLQRRSPLIHEIVEWITRTAPKKQKLLAFGNTIAAIGALLGRRVRSPGNCRTNLYVFGIAGSGRGKEHSRQCISQLFITAGLGHWIGGDKWKSDSGIRTELLKAPAHLAQIDEFGKVLAQVAAPHAPPHLAGIVTTLLELSGRAGGIDHGPSYADQKQRPREVIVEPCLAVYATSVPGDVFASLSSKSVADGFLNRWVCLFGDERPALEESEEPSYAPPAHVIAALQLLETNWRTRPSSGPADAPFAAHPNLPSGMVPAAHVIPRTPDAKDMQRAIARRVANDCFAKEDRGEATADLWARVPELVEKIALILAATRPVLFERRDGVDVATWDGKPAAHATKDRDGFAVEAQVPAMIEVDDVALAHDLVAWAFRRFEEEVRGRVADSQFEGNVKRVLHFIIRAGTKGIEHTPLVRKTQWLRPSERKDILEQLSTSGQVTTTASIAAGKKPVTTYRLAGFAMAGSKSSLKATQARLKVVERNLTESVADA